MVVLDTHVLLWWTLDPQQLSATARNHCDAIRQTGGMISSISLWEIAIKVSRGSLTLGVEFDDYVRRLQSLKGLEILAVDVAHWMENLKLDWAHRDPVDRTIVATAKLFDLPLVSKDEMIQGFYPKTIW